MRARSMTAAVVVVGLLVTAGAGARVAATHRAAVEQRLLVDVVTYIGGIQSELERHVGAAYALRDLFDEGPVVSRAEYERAIETVDLEQFPALRGVNVVRPVSPDEVAGFVREKRTDGYPDYAARQGHGAAAGRSRWLVSLVAPYDTNRHLLGLDVRDVPALAAAYARARDLGEPSLSALVQDDEATPPHTRVALPVPVYAVGAATGTTEDRRERLAGWVVPTVRTSALLPGFATAHDLEVRVVDTTDGGGTVIRDAGVDDGDQDLSVARTMDVYGREWTVRAAPGPGYVTGVERWAAVAVVALGLLLTAVVGALVHLLGQRSAHARRLVDVRTGELAGANAELTAVNAELAMRLEELRHHSRVDGLVRRATWEVTQAGTVEDALERLRLVLGAVADFDRVGFSVRVDDRRMRVQAVAGPAAPMAPAGTDYVAPERLWRSFLTRDLVVVRDTAGTPEGTLERALADRGIRGIVSLPLVARGEVAGIVTVGTTRPLTLGPSDMRLLSRVADGIAGPIVTLLGLEAERHAAEQLRALDEMKDEFLGIVAHDLKGPLSVVTGYTDLLLSDVASGALDPDVVQHGLEAMQRAATNQQRLIADLLESQRLALGVAVPAKAPLVAADLVRETLRDLASGTEGGVAFEDTSDGARVYADAEWLRRVVTNLASNAWKYGGTAIEARVRAGTGTVRVEIADDGAGIAPEDVPRLFQRFSRLVPEGTTATGTGLGLYICKQLIEAHEGRIGVESAPGAGTTFWFELPVAMAPADVEVRPRP
ncbi:MAG: CHASE domain-containing protein [Actinobacteria bacterium]|nr:CHASE domain-containing protein [Actinomycetota bacterium]